MEPVWGAVFVRGGRAGQTVVYVGNDVCAQTQATAYDSGDARIVCFTPPAAGAAPGAAGLTVDVRVAVVDISGANSFVACPSTAACQFSYGAAATPLLQWASLGGAAGTTYKAFGALRGQTADMYNVRVGASGAGGAGGALCDAGVEQQAQASGALSADGGATQQLLCQLGGDTEAGVYPVLNLASKSCC